MGFGALACACNTAAARADTKRKLPVPAIDPELKQLGYDQVQLRDSPLRAQLIQQRDLYSGLDDDRLLKPFRHRAGQPAPGLDMGGWYDDSADFHIDPNDWSTANWHGYIPGHSFGQYVSGLARIYAITGEKHIQKKVHDLVRDYIPTISAKFFDDYHLPAYTYDKLVIGLIDAYQFADVRQAKVALDRVTDAVLPYLPEKALTREERRQRPYTQEAQIWDEPYTLPENLFLAYQRGMGDRYRDLAVRYLQNDALFDPLAAGISPLKGKHAYSHVNALNSAVQAYLVLGDAKYLHAARNGFDFVQRQSFATGGWGANEELLAPDDTDSLLASLTSTHRSFETPCGAYGHFKVARSLLKITRDSRYGDSMERVLYNTILGARPTTPDGDTFYYSDYSNAATKFYRGEKWPCCSGTFIQLTADFGVSAYFQDDGGFYVNLFVPSKVAASLDGKIVTFTQSTQYPLQNSARIEVTPNGPAHFAVHIRIPVWAGAATKVMVNGQPCASAVVPGKFLQISRTWEKGDHIDITFDMGMRLEALNEAHPEVVALMTGPLVLFPIGGEGAKPTRQEWLSASRQNEETWLVRAKTGDVALKPFSAIRDETYRLYSVVAV